MLQSISALLGLMAGGTALGVLVLPAVLAQVQTQGDQPTPITPMSTPRATPTATPQTEFQGRGVAQGSAFNKGRNVNVVLSLTRNNNFILNLSEPPGTRARAEYRGSIMRRNDTTNSPNSFTLDGRVQTFDSSASQRILSNTTGTCRIEVFNRRVISSNCRAATSDSNIQFLGLEQF